MSAIVTHKNDGTLIFVTCIDLELFSEWSKQVQTLNGQMAPNSWSEIAKSTTISYLNIKKKTQSRDKEEKNVPAFYLFLVWLALLVKHQDTTTR